MYVCIYVLMYTCNNVHLCISHPPQLCTHVHTYICTSIHACGWYMRILDCFTMTGPLTSFLDSDGDLSKAPKFTAYSGDKPPSLSRSADSLGRHQQATSGGKPHKGARFSDLELKILRYIHAYIRTYVRTYVHTYVHTQ